MKFISIIILLFEFLLANVYQDVINYKLPNGLNVYLLPNKNSKNVQIEAVVKVGMRAESKENAGISHLLEHLIFRDNRVKYNDYYDLIKENGATYVNGYTSNYTTRYVATIEPSKAKWITKSFYNMLFDKNLTKKDLDVERKALQLEIGEPVWTDYISFNFFSKLGDLIEKLSPKLDYTLYEDDFKIDFKKHKWKRYDALIYKQNNKKFTLDDVLKHYKNYYYPSNITLKIVGNFDINEIKNVINNSYAKLKKRNGKTLEYPIYKDAKLSHKAFIKKGMPGILPNSTISLGYKYIDNNMTKYMIIDAYFQDLASRLNRELRNKHGKSYSVYGASDNTHDAGLGYIRFYTGHKDFESNFKLVKNWLNKEANGDISDKIVKKAIQNSKKDYENSSVDTQTLMDIVDDEIYQKRFYKNSYKNPYDILNTISVKEFKDTIKKSFTKDNYYENIEKDYFLFPYEAFVLLISLIVIFFIILFKINRKIKKRDIVLKRGIVNWFIYILLIIFLVIITGIVSDWVEYGLIKLFGLDISKVIYFGSPLDYLFVVLGFILYIALFIFIAKWLFKWFYTHIVATKDMLYLVGFKSKKISLNDIDSLEVVPWSIDKFKNIYGFGILFFKKLLKITTKNRDIYYIRFKKANELKEDIQKLLNS